MPSPAFLDDPQMRKVVAGAFLLTVLATVLASCGSIAETYSDDRPCEVDADCGEGSCSEWFIDRDGDGHGDAGAREKFCSSGRSDADRRNVTGDWLVTVGDDCCDVGGEGIEIAARIHPRQAELFEVAQSVCPDLDPYDYDCDDSATSDHRAAGTECADLNVDECNALRIWAGGPGSDPPCGGFQVAFSCVATGGACILEGVDSERYDENRCR